MSNKKDHLIVFTISTLIFIAGIYAGSTLSQKQMSEIEVKINEFEDNMNSMSLSVLLNDALNNETLSCQFLKGKLNETKNSLDELGDQVIEYEEDSRINEPLYKELKKQFTMIRAEYWLMLEKLRNQCNNNYTTILFFYQTKQPCNECKDQGAILTHLNSIKDNIFIVPVDADEELLIIEIIKETYSINQAPTMIINANQKIEGLISEQELLKKI